jgi:hypothetical protein
MGEIFILECDTEKEAHRICSENNWFFLGYDK